MASLTDLSLIMLPLQLSGLFLRMASSTEIEQSREIESGELFRRYQNSFHNPVGERAYRNQMEQLVQTGLIREVREGRWKKFDMAVVRP